MFRRAGGTEGLRRPPSELPSHPTPLRRFKAILSAPHPGAEGAPVVPDTGFWLAALLRHVAWVHGLGQTPIPRGRGNTGTGVARPPIPIRPTLGASPSQRRVGGACSDPGIEGHSLGGRYSPSFFGLAHQSEHLQYLYTVTGLGPDTRYKIDPVETGQVLLGRGVNTDPGRREIAASGAVRAQLHRSSEQPRLIFASFWKQCTRRWSPQRRKQHREREKEREKDEGPVVLELLDSATPEESPVS